MSARLRMMQRKSIYEPKRGRELEATQIRDDARSHIRSKVHLQHDSAHLPGTQIVASTSPTTVHRNDVGAYSVTPASPQRHLIVKLPVSSAKSQQTDCFRKQKPGSPKLQQSASRLGQQSGNTEAPKTSIPKHLPTSPNRRVLQSPTRRQQKSPTKRSQEVEASNTRVTRSQARAQAQAVSQNARQPAAFPRNQALDRSRVGRGTLLKAPRQSPFHEPPLAETQLVNEYAVKRRKLNHENKPAKSRLPEEENRGIDIMSTEQTENLKEHAPRKKAKVGKSPEVLLSSRSPKRAINAAKIPSKSLTAASLPRRTSKPAAMTMGIDK